jgi:hypothetical protein
MQKPMRIHNVKKKEVPRADAEQMQTPQQTHQPPRADVGSAGTTPSMSKQRAEHLRAPAGFAGDVYSDSERLKEMVEEMEKESQKLSALIDNDSFSESSSDELVARSPWLLRDPLRDAQDTGVVVDRVEYEELQDRVKELSKMVRDSEDKVQKKEEQINSLTREVSPRPSLDPYDPYELAAALCPVVYPEVNPMPRPKPTHVVDGLDVVKYFGYNYWPCLHEMVRYFHTKPFKKIIIFLGFNAADSEEGQAFDKKWPGIVTKCRSAKEVLKSDDKAVIQYVNTLIARGKDHVRVWTNDNYKDHGVTKEWVQMWAVSFWFVLDPQRLDFGHDMQHEVETTSTRSTGVDRFQ